MCVCGGGGGGGRQFCSERVMTQVVLYSIFVMQDNCMHNFVHRKLYKTINSHNITPTLIYLANVSIKKNFVHIPPFV